MKKEKKPVQMFMPDVVTLEEAITMRFQEYGRRGGRSKSPAKLAAVRENAKKANAARWPNRNKVKDD